MWRSRPAASSGWAFERSRTRQRTDDSVPASEVASRAPMKPVAPAMRVLSAISKGSPIKLNCKTGAVSVHVLERSQRVEVSVEQAFDFMWTPATWSR